MDKQLAPARSILLASSMALALAVVGCAPSDGTPSAGESTQTGDDALKSCPSGATVEGVDVSEFQGNINWAELKASGRAFAVIRVADGHYFDPKFDQNWAGAKKAGMVRGVYQFFRASEDGTSQANFLLSHVTIGAGDLPPVADVEVTDGVGPGTLNANLTKWMTRIKQATGKTPIIYTSPGLWPSLSGSSAFKTDTLWVANWGVSCPSLPTPWGGWKFWQYADNGHVGGISGAVDLDRFDGSLAELEQFAGGKSGPPTEPKPAKPTKCGEVAVKQGLAQGDSVDSCDGRFTLTLQSDGNLVLYKTGGKALWSSQTNGDDGYAMWMQADGNLVVYDPYGAPLWASGTNGHAGATLAVQDDGNVVLYDAGKAIWATHTEEAAPTMPIPAKPSSCGVVSADHGLGPGETASSCDGRFDLVMQGDGNLVLYMQGKALWASGTDGQDGYAMVMQGDGNLVLYSPYQKALWNTGTQGHGGADLAIQNDGNLVVYQNGKALWASHTSGH